MAQKGSEKRKKAQKGSKRGSKRLFEPARCRQCARRGCSSLLRSVPPVRSKRLFETAVRDCYSKVLGSAALCSEPLYSALLCSVHVYARVHTIVYIYINVYNICIRYIKVWTAHEAPRTQLSSYQSHRQWSPAWTAEPGSARGAGRATATVGKMPSSRRPTAAGVPAGSNAPTGRKVRTAPLVAHDIGFCVTSSRRGGVTSGPRAAHAGFTNAHRSEGKHRHPQTKAHIALLLQSEREEMQVRLKRLLKQGGASEASRKQALMPCHGCFSSTRTMHGSAIGYTWRI